MNRSRGNSFWRAPGNANLFDTALENWEAGRMSRRTISCLKYIKNHDNYIKKDDFENNIKGYINSLYRDEINNSNEYSFYSPLVFLGLINDIENKFQTRFLSLSIDGKEFLNKIENCHFEEAKNFLIFQMLKTRYPNRATKGIELHLFPFRIIFKLLIEQNGLLKKDFETKIPYIRSIDDIYKFNNLECTEYNKWSCWEIPWLVKSDILKIENDKILISNSKIDFIRQFIDKMEYKEMFFNTSQEEVYLKNNINKKVSRNGLIISNAIKRDNCKCFFDNTHKTFRTNNKDNYVEGHHIIPISLQDSFRKNLDSENNVISLCPNCHRAIHFAINEHKEQLLAKIYDKTNIKKDYDISLENLKEIYYSNLNLDK